MATEKQADRARKQHSEKLRKLGAHAIAVEEVKQGGKSTFAVVATFEKKPKSTPSVLPVKIGRQTYNVELIARRGPKFELE